MTPSVPRVQGLRPWAWHMVAAQEKKMPPLLLGRILSFSKHFEWLRPTSSASGLSRLTGQTGRGQGRQVASRGSGPSHTGDMGLGTPGQGERERRQPPSVSAGRDLREHRPTLQVRELRPGERSWEVNIGNGHSLTTGWVQAPGWRLAGSGSSFYSSNGP